MINKTKLAVCTAPIPTTDDSFGDFTYEWIIPAANDACLLASGQEESAWGGGIVDHGVAPQQECEFSFDAVDGVQKADALDYSIAAASGLLCSLIDIFWVGKFNLADAEHWGKEKASQFVLGVAQSKGYKGETLAGAIRFLEKAFPIPSDLLTSEFGGGLQHHLRDFGHHPTLLGLFFSLLTQFTGLGFGTDTEGSFIVRKLPDQAALGKTIHEKIFNGIIIWAFHLISDLDGSSSSPGAGTGIPGPLLATLKELSALPLINEIQIHYCKPGHNEDVSFSAFVSKLFNGTYFMNQDGSNRVPFDLRAEIGLAHDVGRQTVPVLVNECIVRAFYSIRRFAKEITSLGIHTISDLQKVDPKAFLPIKSRELTRMLTVATGVFMVIETSEAAVSAALNSHGSGSAFARQFFVKVNFVGVGRFVFACVADGRYIAEDIRKTYQDFENQYQRKQRTQANAMAWMKHLMLTPEQTSILYSLKRQKVLYDVSRESKAAKAALKQEWLNTWCGLCNEQNIVIIDAENDLYSAINQMVAKEMPSPGWFYLVAMELLLFTPYTQLSENDGKKYSKLSLCSQYETEVFTERQTSISAKEIDSLRKAYRESLDYLNNKTKKAVSAAASIIAITAASGGVAWILAPQIAVALGGSAFAGLHGIALVNASLAALGGGSLAAGGLGVAGGTAIIAGGGALLGVAGSGTVSITAMALLTSKGFAVQECAKLLAYCSFSIKSGLMDHQALKDIRMALLDGIAMMKQQIEQQNPSKGTRKAYDNSFKYLERCSSRLEKLAKKNERHQHKLSFSGLQSVDL